MFRESLSLLKKLALAVVVLLGFLSLVELLRVFQTLHALHPWAGYAFAAALVGAAGWLCYSLLKALAGNPPVLTPPRIDDPANAGTRRLHSYARYLRRYLGRLAKNPNLPQEQQQLAKHAIERLSTASGMAGRDEMLAAILAVENDTVKPLLNTLSNLAEREIRSSLMVVMAGVTLSPYKAADLLIVLYRNIAMLTRIIRIYNARPRLRETLRVFADILTVVATVNYINMGKNLIEGLASRVPFIGRFTDDIAQGIGAGFMTSIAGHAAVIRCQAFRGWDASEAQFTIGAKAAGFYADVRDIFRKDILPQLMNRIGTSSRETAETINEAIDDTGRTIKSFIRTPLTAAVSATNASGRAARSTRAWLAGKLLRRKQPPGA